MPNRENFPEIFAQLKAHLQAFAPSLIVRADTADNYYLDVPASSTYPKGLFFGAVQIKKNYVSYHLMPIYMFPDLVEDLSDQLKKRMQGKSCFNFTVMSDTLNTELAQLTAKSFQRLLGPA
jgi:hypothetical protein